MKILLKENCAHIKYATFENSENVKEYQKLSLLNQFFS